jgi:hypothetical protein
VNEKPFLVEFAGPFSWVGGDEVPCIFETMEGKNQGVYLWTVQLEAGELIYYVGETGRSFSQRMLEHFGEHMSGGYHLYEPHEFSCGRKILLWPGSYGPTKETSLVKFFQQFQSLASAMADLARIYRFYLCPLECDRRLRERIEAGLANYLYGQVGLVGEFQDEGIFYRPRKDSEEPFLISFRSRQNLMGIPESLWV